MRISDWSSDVCSSDLRMQRAADAGSQGLIATLDWSFSMGRDWGSPEIPEKVDLKTMIRMSPQVATRPRWLYDFARTGQIPDLTAPNLAAPGEQKGPTFFGAYYEWMTTPPPSRSEEHTSELQSLMRLSYAVFCLQKKTQQNYH